MDQVGGDADADDATSGGDELQRLLQRLIQILPHVEVRMLPSSPEF